MNVFADPVLDQDDLGLQLVSRYWCEVFVATPQFWSNAIANLRIEYDLPFLDMWISRIGALPLQLLFTDGIKCLLNCLPSVRSRASDLEIENTYADEWPALRDMLRLQWPNLERFEFGGFKVNIPTTDTPIVCLEENFPRLRRLGLPGLCLAPTSTPSLLRELELVGKIDSFRTLVDALKRCPGLENLIFRSIFFGDGGEPLEAGTITRHEDSLSLPHLQHPYVGAFSVAGTARLLTHLTFPYSTYVKLKMDVSDPEPVLLPPASPAFHASPSVDRLHITCFRDWMRFIARCYAQDWEKLHLDMDLDGEEAFLCFLTPLRALPITTLSMNQLEPVDWGFPRFWVAALFDALPNLRRLELLHEMLHPCRQKIAKAFLETQTARGVGPLTLAWTLLPSMDEFTGTTGDLRDLAALLRARRDEGAAPLHKLELHPPTFRMQAMSVITNYLEGLPTPFVVGKYDESVVDELRDLAPCYCHR